MIKHFKNNCVGSSSIMKIMEIFPGTGYRSNKVYPFECAKGLKIEDY